MLAKLRAFGRNQMGVTLLEYAFIAVLVSIAGITLLFTLGHDIVEPVFSRVNSDLSQSGS